MYDVQQQDIDLLRQRTKTIYTKIQLMNSKFMVIDEIQGVFIDGSISIDSGSDVRSTFDATILVKDDSYITAEKARIWIDKHVRVFIGFLNQRTGETVWYPKGVYNFNDNSFTYDSTTRTLKISCLDLVSTLNGTLGGTLIGNETQIPKDSNIRDAIIKTVTQLGQCSSYRIGYQNATVPYDMSWDTGSSVWDVLTELRDLYYSYEMFFDEDTFVCQRVPMDNGEPVVLDNTIFDDCVISESLTNSFSEVRNVIEVWGETTKSNYYADTSSYANNVYTFKVTGASITNGKKFSFLAPQTNTGYCQVQIVNTEADANTGAKKDVVYGPYPLYRSEVSDTGADQYLSAGTMENGKYYVIKFKKENNVPKFIFVGQTQIHAMARLVEKTPTAEQAAKDKVNFACDNIGYVVNPESPFTLEKIGERIKVCNGGDYEKIYTDELALQRAEYELYLGSRLTDSISVECLLIPWLDVNQKISYTAHMADVKEPRQYMISSINFDLGSGTMTVKMARFYPYYPNTVVLVPTYTVTG